MNEPRSLRTPFRVCKRKGVSKHGPGSSQRRPASSLVVGQPQILPAPKFIMKRLKNPRSHAICPSALPVDSVDSYLSAHLSLPIAALLRRFDLQCSVAVNVGEAPQRLGQFARGYGRGGGGKGAQRKRGHTAGSSVKQAAMGIFWPPPARTQTRAQPAFGNDRGLLARSSKSTPVIGLHGKDGDPLGPSFASSSSSSSSSFLGLPGCCYCSHSTPHLERGNGLGLVEARRGAEVSAGKLVNVVVLRYHHELALAGQAPKSERNVGKDAGGERQPSRQQRHRWDLVVGQACTELGRK